MRRTTHIYYAYSYLVMKWFSRVHIFILSSMEQFVQWADHVQHVGFVLCNVSYWKATEFGRQFAFYRGRNHSPVVLVTVQFSRSFSEFRCTGTAKFWRTFTLDLDLK